MKKIRAESAGGPEVMQLVDEPLPPLGPGMARVRVRACGVNFIDIYHRSGQYKVPVPLQLGQEGAGVVEEVSPGVSQVKAGDRVAWAACPGSYATHVMANENVLVPVPDGVDFDTAAAAMLQGMTAHYLSHDTFPLSPNDTCLVHAAAGGVGQLLCQMAKAKGSRVLATVSTEEKARKARRAGADDVFLYTQVDFEAEAKRLTSGRGVDVVYDSVGKNTFEASLRCLRLRGMLVLFGQSSGAVAPFDPQLLAARGSLFLTRPTLAHYTGQRQELLARAAGLFALITAGKLKIEIGLSLPLERAAEAHRLLAERKTTGKILLLPE
jgi:NADPH2:quinone reductase